MWINKYVFSEDMLGDTLIFSIPKAPGTYVTQKFVDLVKENNLTGFRFDEIGVDGIPETKEHKKVKKDIQKKPSGRNFEHVELPDEEVIDEIQQNEKYAYSILETDPIGDHDKIMDLIVSFTSNPKKAGIVAKKTVDGMEQSKQILDCSILIVKIAR